MLNVKDSHLAGLVSGTVIVRDPHDLALGWLRYKAIRKLNPVQFHELFSQALVRDVPFDALVDELVLKEFG